MAEVDPELLATLEVIEENLKYWELQKKDVQDKMKSDAGEDEKLTVNGKQVYSYNWINKLRENDLKKEEPDTYEHFLEVQTVEVFNAARFKRIYPDKYREYQVRQLRKSSGS